MTLTVSDGTTMTAQAWSLLLAFLRENLPARSSKLCQGMTDITEVIPQDN